MIFLPPFFLLTGQYYIFYQKNIYIRKFHFESKKKKPKKMVSCGNEKEVNENLSINRIHDRRHILLLLLMSSLLFHYQFYFIRL